jgi:hypothetical protein
MQHICGESIQGSQQLLDSFPTDDQPKQFKGPQGYGQNDEV